MMLKLNRSLKDFFLGGPLAGCVAASVLIAGSVGASDVAAAFGGESPSLTLNKIVIGGSAVPTDFVLSADGPSPISGAGGATSGPGFAAGTYLLSESGVSGYGDLGWICTGGSQDANQIVIEDADAASCSITNEICGSCTGKVSEILFLYSGEDADVIMIARRGPEDVEVFSGVLASGAQANVVGPAGGVPAFTSTLGNELDIFVDGELHTRIHTSCSAPLGPGFTSGDFEILVVRSRDGGLICQDSDFDGVADFEDNCTLVNNPDQRDTDSDGYGNFCDPDLNNDGMVNFLDLIIIKDRFFSADPDADLNGDGMVNFGDLDITKQYFFGPPGPSAFAP